MPSRFPWGIGKSSKKAEQEFADESSRASSSRSQYSQGQRPYAPDPQPSEYEHNNYEAYSRPYISLPDSRTGPGPISLTIPQPASGERPPHYSQEPTPISPSATDKPLESGKGLRNKFGLSSRENLSEFPPDDGHRRNKLGFKRRASRRRRDSPSGGRHEPSQNTPSVQEHELQARKTEIVGQYPEHAGYEQEPRLPSLVSDDDPNYTSNNSRRTYDPQREASFSPNRSSSYIVYRGGQPEPQNWPPPHTYQQPDQGYNGQSDGQQQHVQQYEQRRGSDAIFQQQADQQPPSQPPTRSGSVLRKQFVQQPSTARTQSQRLSRNLDNEVTQSQLSQSSTLKPGLLETDLHQQTSPSMSPNPQTGPSPGARSAVSQSTQPAQSQPVAEGDGAGEMSEQEVQQLMKEYRELREKYSKVKRYYFEKDDQVKQLQNTLAHQRLSASRTSLDDGEYIARFNRLDGLISQLSFGFRKDWKSIPQWLQPAVNKDAIATGKQEMIAVGRAFISRWLVDEIFDKYFSPALDVKLSKELKTIQHNIRAFHPPFQSGEEVEALTAKIINWRLATIDGLQPLFSAADAATHRKQLVEKLDVDLVNSIKEHMSDPPPAGLEGGVHMIVELAVAVLSNLPFESRDVQIEFYPPGVPLVTDLMKVETSVPPLQSPITPIPELQPETDRASVMSTTESASDAAPDELEPHEKDQKKGFLGGLMGSKKPGNGHSKHGSQAGSQVSLHPPGSSSGPKEEVSPRVRLCVFLSLQIRGKMVLAKAPVYKG